MSKIKKISRFVFDEFIYGGHFQSLGAASIVFVSALLLKIKISWDILSIVYLIFYSLYLYNHLKEDDVDYLTNLRRTQHLRKYKKIIPKLLCSIIIVLVAGLIYFSNLWAVIFGLFLIIFGFLYTVFFKKAIRIVFFKDIYVSIFFALLPFFLLVYYSYPATYSLIIGVSILSLFVFLKTFISQIFLDIKDIESDKKEGLRTFPIIIGKENTFTILFVFNFLVTIIIPVGFSFYFNIFPKIILMLIFTIPFSLYCYNLAKKQKYSGYILQSGEFILWLFLIFVGKIIL